HRGDWAGLRAGGRHPAVPGHRLCLPVAERFAVGPVPGAAGRRAPRRLGGQRGLAIPRRRRGRARASLRADAAGTGHRGALYHTQACAAQRGRSRAHGSELADHCPHRRRGGHRAGVCPAGYGTTCHECSRTGRCPRRDGQCPGDDRGRARGQRADGRGNGLRQSEIEAAMNTEQTALSPEQPAAEPAPEAPAPRQSTVWRLLKNVQASVCLVYLLLVILFGLLSPWLAPYGPNVTNLSAVNAPPFSSLNFLGGDASGRDILSRLMWGTRETLLACLIIAAVSLPLGVVTGLVAGFYRGRFGAVANWISDVIMSLPGIVLLIALFALTGPNIPIAMAVFGILVSPTYFRIVRGIVSGIRNEAYIEA